MTAPAPMFGVAQSLTGRRWIGPDAETERMGLAIAQQARMPEIVGRILAARGILPEDAADYLSPTLRALMPDPSIIADMDLAAERLASAVTRGERIAIFGDYDVDGGASTAILIDWLRQLGMAATPYIPDRIDEGYGPNEAAMAALAEAHDLILCVDCGTLSHGPIAAAKGADVIIADHHLAGETLPDALAVVNPNRADDTSDLGHLCAAGVVFMLLAAANRILRGQGRFASQREPDLRGMLDLVALATVADVAPLTGLNRAFVRQGLSVIAGRGRPGIAALSDCAGLTARPTSTDLGFALGPRINAGGRIGEADLGMRLLTTTDPNEARALADRLDELNRKRREIEAQVLAAATEQIEQRDYEAPLVWAAAEGWHPGVVGIVASRLKDRFHRPAIVIGLDGAEGKGSGRSVPGVDLGRAVGALAGEGVLLKGGGHVMAAGLTVAAERVEEAMAALTARIDAAEAMRAGPGDLVIDGALMPGAATPDLVETLESAGPFGPANPAPRIVFGQVQIAHFRIVGKGHAQIRVSAGKERGLDAIAFRAEESGLAQAFSSAFETAGAMHVAGTLEIDDWGGRRRAKLRVEDAAPA
ncbi:MAG: single-stranded-DNA-specific exonuclease RecJ [Pseudomonadota bacterium]